MVISLLCLPFAFGIDTAAFVLISIYFSFCTYSLYRKLEKQSNQGTGYGAPSELTTINTSPNKQPQVGYP